MRCVFCGKAIEPETSTTNWALQDDEFACLECANITAETEAGINPLDFDQAN